MNDNKLILQIQRGNRRCADELVERYYSSILRYCSWHCYNTDRAEDLTQETFLRVFRDIYMYVLTLSWDVMISLCHADMRLPG